MPERLFIAPESQRGPDRRAVGALAAWIWSVLLIADAMLLARKWTGHFDMAIPASLAIASTLFVAGASWFALLCHRHGDSKRSPRTTSRVIPAAISLVITLGWCVGISAQSSSLTIGLLAGILLVHLLSAVILNAVPPESRHAVVQSPAPPSSSAAGLNSQAVTVDVGTTRPAALPSNAAEQTSLAAISDQDGEQEFDEDLERPLEEDLEHQTLWLSRRFDGKQDIVEGWIRIEFEAGQRETVVHLAFCPPLAGKPEIETEDLEGAGLEIRVAAAFPFGARLSVRRSNPRDEDRSNRVAFVASATAIERAA